MRLRIRPALYAALLLLPGVAAAQTVSPEQATTLHQQLTDWLAGLLGPSVKLPELPLKITADQDHYNLSWPVRGLDSPAGDVAATATLRPLDGGRWSLESVTLPPAGTFIVKVPDTPNTPNAGPMKVEFTIGKQDTHATIDPSLATASTSHTEMHDVTVTVDAAKHRQEQHVDSYVGNGSLSPVKDGRLDLTSDGTVEGWKSAQQMQSGAPVAIGVQTMHAVSHVEGIDPDHVGKLLAATGGLIGAMPPDAAAKGAKTELPPLARAQLRSMIAALQDVSTSVSLQETLDGVQVEIAGVGGATIKHIQFGFGGDAPKGELHTWLDIGFEGVDSPTMPPKLATYLPRHFEIKPTLSGVPTAALQKLAMDATEDDKAKHPVGPDFTAIFANGGANVGLEVLSFDLGPAKVEGTGQVTMVSPTTWHGEAHLTATGFDDLATQARENPDLQQALPVLIMMRGLAKPDGDKLVWNVVSDGPKLTVNGIDMSALAGSKPPAQPVKP